MTRKLRILNLEDNPVDSELIQTTLAGEEIESEIVRVETREGFVTALETGEFDIILADYSLPGFNGMSALDIALKKSPSVPFIFVTGAMGEDLAIETLKRGAVDYVLKTHLSKLAPAVKRALQKSEEALERKKTEEALCESEERFRSVADTATDAIIILKEPGVFCFWNKKAEEMFGYRANEATGKLLHDLICPERHRNRARERLKKFFDTGHGLVIGKIIEIEGLRMDGTEFPVELSVSAMNIRGKWYATAIVRDITKRKWAENALRENEERYHLVTELTSDFIFRIIFSPDGQMVLESITQKFTDITGYSPDEIKTPDDWEKKICADDRPILKDFFKVILSGQLGECKLRGITKNGEIKWIRVFGRPLRDGHKQRITGIIGAAKDITEYIRAEEERKQLQGELVEKERFLEAVLQQMPIGVIVAEAPSGKLYLSNRKVAELLRHPFYSSAAIEQYVQYKGFHPDGRQYMPEEWPLARSVKAGEVVEGEEVDYLRGDGSHCWLEVHSGPIRNDQGQLTGAIVSFFDITKRKQALKRIEKLNSFLISIRKINEALVRSKDEVALFHVVCDSLNRVGFVRFTWIGLLEEGESDIKSIAHAGFEDGFLSSVTLRWDDIGYSASPAGIAVKMGKPYILTDIEKDPVNEDWRKEALKRGYKACVALPLKYDEKNIGVFVVFSGTKEAISEEEIGYLQEVATDISVGIKSLRLERELQQSYEKTRKALDGTVEAIAKTCELRDPYTAGHEKRVAQLACAIARKMRLSENQIEGIRVTSYIHDIGKIEVPAEILSKPTRLTDIEFSLIKAHAQTGYEILKGVEFPWPVAQIVLQHQERLDGSGYPNGLKGKEIMLEARILAVADTVEAMSSHRPYRPALGLDMALKEITQEKGILYDPAVVDACVRLFKDGKFEFNK